MHDDSEKTDVQSIIQRHLREDQKERDRHLAHLRADPGGLYATASDWGPAPKLAWQLDAMIFVPTLVFIALIATVGLHFHPSKAYFGLSIPGVVLATFWIARKVQPHVVGRMFKPRYSDPRPYTNTGAWMRALFNASCVVWCVWFLIATVGNAALGSEVSHRYTVVDHYLESGRGGTCYGLDLRERHAPNHSLSLCVSQVDQALDHVGASMVVQTKASWFGYKVLSSYPDESRAFR